jgi:hypothetical protein
MDGGEVGEEMTYLVSSYCERGVEEQDSVFCPFCQISVDQHRAQPLHALRSRRMNKWIESEGRGRGRDRETMVMKG